MSHDRGCPCGRDLHDYVSCTLSPCYRQEDRNRDRYAQLTLAPKSHVQRVADQIMGLTRLEKIELVKALEKEYYGD